MSDPTKPLIELLVDVDWLRLQAIVAQADRSALPGLWDSIKGSLCNAAPATSWKCLRSHVIDAIEIVECARAAMKLPALQPVSLAKTPILVWLCQAVRDRLHLNLSDGLPAVPFSEAILDRDTAERLADWCAALVKKRLDILGTEI